MTDINKISIEKLQQAKTPEDIQRILKESGGIIGAELNEADAPGVTVDVENDYPEDGTIEQSLLVPPSELERLKKQTKINTPNKKKEDRNSINYEKFKLRSGKVAINFESNGRFSIPDSAYFGDYSVQDTNDLVLSREDEIFDTLIAILDKVKNDDSWSLKDATLEELLEIVIGMKIQFNTNSHTLRWFCSCQDKLPEEQRKLSEMEIDLSTIKYISIEECEQEIKNHFRELFEQATDEQFSSYLLRKYGEDALELSNTREAEVESIQVKEPLVIRDAENVYELRLPRVEDLSKGLRFANKKWNWQIRKLRNTRVDEKNEEALIRREFEIEKLEAEKQKDASLATRALSLLKYNGEEIISDDVKYKIFSEMSRSTMIKLSTISDRLRFGVQDERDIECNLCHKVEQRLLQRVVTPLEFVPFDSNTRISSKRKLPVDSGLDIYFGT